MKVIVFKCIDNFGKHYKFAKTCADDKVKETINDALAKSTEIYDTETLDLIK